MTWISKARALRANCFESESLAACDKRLEQMTFLQPANTNLLSQPSVHALHTWSTGGRRLTFTAVVCSTLLNTVHDGNEETSLCVCEAGEREREYKATEYNDKQHASALRRHVRCRLQVAALQEANCRSRCKTRVRHRRHAAVIFVTHCWLRCKVSMVYLRAGRRYAT